jgi:IPT/TIG domain-containing protein/HYDIN/CFA65/VesB family protein
MQKCKRCGQDLSDDARICLFCGQPVEAEDEERRRRLMLRWHLSALLLGRKRSARGFLFSPALPGIPSSQRLPASILVFLTSVFILFNIVLAGVLQAYTGSVSPPPLTFTFPLPPSVSPTLLDFGKVEVGSQAILPVIVKTSNHSQLSWRIVSGNTQWLSITLRSETKESDNHREVIYDVAANTSKLQVGPYSETLSVRSDGGKEQRVDVKIQVIPPGPPQPPKLNVNPPMLDFGSQNMGNQKTLLLTVSNSGGSELSWTADKGKTSWLTLDVSGGKIPAGEPPQVIKVKVDTTNLAGTYSSHINFTSNDGNAVVDVKLNVVSTPIAGQGPVVSSISPTSGPETGGTTVTITGSGFTGATGVSFGSTAATIVSVDSDTQIMAISPGGRGIVDVTVTTPGGTSAPNAFDRFSYFPRPEVTGVSPNCVLLVSGITVTITGSGFTGATGVLFGSTAGKIVSVDSDTQITVIIPTGSGTVDVTVTTPGGTSPISPDDEFVYPLPPVVKGINRPASGPEAGGTNVTINGINFTCASSVSFGSTAATKFTVDSDNQITAVSPAGSGTVDVTVTNPGDTSATNAFDRFTYIPRPIVKFIMPKNGPVAGGTKVNIFGSYFTGATSVLFGKTAATDFTFISDSQITAISPAGSANSTVEVTVTTPGGTSIPNNDDLFTYLPPPTVTGISPTSGSKAGDTTVTIKGFGFTGATKVLFGQTAEASFTVDSNTQITAISPPLGNLVCKCPLTVDVTVTTPGGTSATSPADQFTYY